MRAIKNVSEKELVISFEGFDYIFPKEKPVVVDEALYNHVLENWPLAFNSYSGGKKEIVPTIMKKKTRSFAAGRTVFGKPGENAEENEVEGLPASGTVDKDGVAWFGEGLEEDKV